MINDMGAGWDGSGVALDTPLSRIFAKAAAWPLQKSGIRVRENLFFKGLAGSVPACSISFSNGR